MPSIRRSAITPSSAADDGTGARANVVRLDSYTTDVEGFAAARAAVQQRLDAAECRYAATLLGVARLAWPELLIELEATAARTP